MTITAFVVITAISCVLDLVVLVAWQDHKAIRDAPVGAIAFAIGTGWAWCGWGIWLAVHGQTSGTFAGACGAAGLLGLADFVGGLREGSWSRQVFNLWNVLYAVLALFVAGVPR